MAVTTAMALVVTVPSLAQGATPTTKRVSVRSNGTQANGSSYRQAISGNGRFVAFDSGARNLVAGDSNGVHDVFVHDRETKKTKRVSVRSNGTQADEGSYSPAISGNGRFVAFSSYASNLVAGDSNGSWDVFVHDRKTKETRRVSVGSDGAQADAYSDYPAISGNGRFVAFISLATNLVAGDSNGAWDVFVHDRETKETRRVSVGSDGAQADGYSNVPTISGNGRFVGFESDATNLVADDTNGVTDVFVHDRETNETKRVSVGSNGTQADGGSSLPAISGNGRFVAFLSGATNLVAGDTNEDFDVFVHDRETNETKRVSVGLNGAQAESGSSMPAISGNGRFVAFESFAANLVAGDTNGSADVFVHDRETNQTKRVSVRSNGAQGDGDSYAPAISGNGRFVAFFSFATNLVAGDTNNRSDVFVRGPLY
jgi:cold shock CspA family protein